MFAEAYTGKIWKVQVCTFKKNKDQTEKILYMFMVQYKLWRKGHVFISMCLVSDLVFNVYLVDYTVLECTHQHPTSASEFDFGIKYTNIL